MNASLDDLYRAAIRLHQQGRTRDAAALYDRILAARPDHAGALHLKGVLALQAGDVSTAIGLIERSLRIQPQHGLALSNLGVAYRGAGRLDDAIRVLRRAVTLDPDSADAWANLGQTLIRTGDVREAVVSLRRALRADPDRILLLSALLFAENYLAESDAVEMAGRARHVGVLMTRAAPPRQTHHNVADPERRLKVGLVSGDLAAHPVGRFLAGVLAEIDPLAIELFAYSSRKDEDQFSAALRQSIPHWLNAADMTDAALVARILADKIDVLVDLSGHTASHRLMVFSQKPAPVSLTWLGYFATTGLGAIDYVLANKWVIPRAEENQWTEQVWRMPDTYLCFTVPTDAPPTAALPARANGHVTFGCFNNFNKLSDGTLRAWARLLAALPGAKLILRSSGAYHEGVVANLERRLDDAGIDRRRVRIDGKIASYVAHLESYGEIDVALDPFPYNGGTTTVEALYMGVPVLVRAGDRYVAHMGESILHNAGLAEWIAASEDDYSQLGARLATDLEALADLRAGLRERMLASPLFDAVRFARNFEEALRGMWRIWCADQHHV